MYVQTWADFNGWSLLPRRAVRKSLSHRANVSGRIDGSLLCVQGRLEKMLSCGHTDETHSVLLFSCCKRKFIGPGLSRKGINKDTWREVLVTTQMFSIVLFCVFCERRH